MSILYDLLCTVYLLYGDLSNYMYFIHVTMMLSFIHMRDYTCTS